MRAGGPSGGRCLADGWHPAGGGGGQRRTGGGGGQSLAGGGGGQSLADGGGDWQHAARVTAVDDGRRLGVSDVTALVLTQGAAAVWVAKASTLGPDGGP